MEKGRAFEIYKIFQFMFPEIGEKTKTYGPFDRNSIKINMTDKKVYIFVYFNERDWGLRTYKNYMDSFKMVNKA